MLTPTVTVRPRPTRRFLLLLTIRRAFTFIPTLTLLPASSLVTAFTLLSLLTACARISPFSETAYRQAVSLKVGTLAVMEKAEDPYESHKAEVDRLLLELDTAYEYARGRPDNEASTRQWEVLKDRDRNLVGGFLSRWAPKGVLTRTFINEGKGVVAEAFDAISALESGKKTP